MTHKILCFLPELSLVHLGPRSLLDPGPPLMVPSATHTDRGTAGAACHHGGVRTNRALELIEELGTRDGRLLHVERLPARPGTTTDWPEWADPDLVAGYRRLGIARPWTHQADAAAALHAGRHTVISTGTGSGKSLPAWLAAISAVRQDAADAATPSAGRISRYRRRPTTLYLAPTKALAADQLAGLDALLRAAQLTSVRAPPATATPLHRA